MTMSITCEEISDGPHMGRRITVWTDNTSDPLLDLVITRLRDVFFSALTLGAFHDGVPLDCKWEGLGCAGKVIDAEMVEVKP
jgi:hypothetical protein